MMKIHGYQVRPWIIRELEDRMRQGAFTQSGLVAYAERLGVPEKTAVLNPKIGGHKEVLCADRLADRLIQKHRKAGNIVRSVDDRGVAREWFWQEKVPLA